MRLWLVCLFGCALAAELVSKTASALTPIRVLPLGDSITYGSGAPGGYRGPLYTLLANAGYSVDLVGTQTGNSVATLPDPDHEGHSGWRIDQIDSIILNVLAQIALPDVILVLIGTNDYGQNYDTAHAADRLEALIAKMATNRPSARIVVANLLVREEPNNTAIQTTFNPFVPGIVARQAALGRNVYFTDLRSAVPLSDMPDQLHPNLAGYTKMATNWFNAIMNVFEGDSTNPPALLGAVGSSNRTEILVSFSKPLEEEATNVAHFAISGGLRVAGARFDSYARRDILLATDPPQAPSTLYTLTVSGVRDRSTNRNAIAAGSVATFRSASAPGAFNSAPEAGDYSLVYSLSIPNAAAYLPFAPRYSVDTHTNAAEFDRLAYYLELQPTNGPRRFVWVSMDPFTRDAARIGVPAPASGAMFQQPLTNMNVDSDVPGLVPGTNMSGGNVEFWPGNCTPTNSAGVPNASSAVFDWGDQPAAGSYGCMQIHNHGAGQVLLAFNNWAGAGGNIDLGIGNNTGNANPDWTLMKNAASYALKTLQVLVRPAANRPPAMVRAVAREDGAGVIVTFSKPLEEAAADPRLFALNGGLTVLRAELDLSTKLVLMLTTPPLRPSRTYTLTANGVRDRTASHTPIAPDSSISFRSAPALSLDIAVAGATPALTLNGSSNRTYTIEFSTNLTAGWMFLTNVVSDGSDGIAIPDPANPPPAQRFYRVTAP